METKDKHRYGTYHFRPRRSDPWNTILDYSKKYNFALNELFNILLEEYGYEFLSHLPNLTSVERDSYHKEYLKHNYGAYIKEPAPSQTTDIFLNCLKKTMILLDQKNYDLIE